MICSSLCRARFMGRGSVCPFRGRPSTQLWPNHRGKLTGIHYLQEDHPEVIGASVKEWLIDLGVVAAVAGDQALNRKRKTRT
jgi:hypothetical protein